MFKVRFKNQRGSCSIIEFRSATLLDLFVFVRVENATWAYWGHVHIFCNLIQIFSFKLRLLSFLSTSRTLRRSTHGFWFRVTKLCDVYEGSTRTGGFSFSVKFAYCADNSKIYRFGNPNKMFRRTVNNIRRRICCFSLLFIHRIICRRTWYLDFAWKKNFRIFSEEFSQLHSHRKVFFKHYVSDVILAQYRSF